MAPPRNRGSQLRSPNSQSSEPPGPLVLGPSSMDNQIANETTVSMNAQRYASQQNYASYPPQMSPGFSGYTNADYQHPQSGQFAALLESSRKGQTTALLLILFGLLLLIAAVIIFLLTLQGTIFSA